uniref:DM2 domain-containing protein n=1 Tax=viral metagenome TaxID=1070528 RepID=A0A6C0LQK5_9ZZZZ
MNQQISNIKEIKKKLKKNYIEQQELMRNMSKIVKQSKKNISSKKKNARISEFDKIYSVPEKLRKLLGLDDIQISKQKIIQLMYKYFQENEMIDPKNKEITPSMKVKKILNFDESEIITFNNLQFILKNIYDNDQI